MTLSSAPLVSGLERGSTVAYQNNYGFNNYRVTSPTPVVVMKGSRTMMEIGKTTNNMDMESGNTGFNLYSQNC